MAGKFGLGTQPAAQNYRDVVEEPGAAAGLASVRVGFDSETDRLVSNLEGVSKGLDELEACLDGYLSPRPEITATNGRAIGTMTAARSAHLERLGHLCEHAADLRMRIADLTHRFER